MRLGLALLLLFGCGDDDRPGDASTDTSDRDIEDASDDRAASDASPDAAPPLPAVEYGQYPLADLDVECEGRAGLTGRSLLDVLEQRVALATATSVSYADPSGTTTGIDPTDATVVMRLPADPVATCYPGIPGYPQYPPWVAIDRVAFELHTDDGHFDETLVGLAARTDPSVVVFPMFTAYTRLSELRGSYAPDPMILSSLRTLMLDDDPVIFFRDTLATTQARGTFGFVESTVRDALRAGFPGLVSPRGGGDWPRQ